MTVQIVPQIERDSIYKLIESGKSIPSALDIALNHGTSVGGARPKATLDEDNKKWIAKFSSSTDVFPNNLSYCPTRFPSISVLFPSNFTS